MMSCSISFTDYNLCELASDSVGIIGLLNHAVLMTTYEDNVFIGEGTHIP